SGGSISATTGAYQAGATGGVTDVVLLTDSTGGIATASVAVGPSITISPASPQVHPGESVSFTATGGSGAGDAWSLADDASGASLSADGAYVAGKTAGVTDQVAVVDSLGNRATTSVVVTPVAVPPKGCGCGADPGASAIGGLAALAILLRRRRRSAR